MIIETGLQFKVGDRVRVRAVASLSVRDHGRTGVVDMIYPDAPHPYGVTHDGDAAMPGTGAAYSADELEPEIPVAEPVPSPVSATGTTPPHPMLARPSALTTVVDAATVVADAAPGVPGAMARRQQLEAMLAELRSDHADLDVVIAAALWVDRYGRAGAVDYLDGLRDAVRAVTR